MREKKINLYWYDEAGLKNFGDELSPYIIIRIFNVTINDNIHQRRSLSFSSYIITNIYKIINIFIKLRNKIFSKSQNLKIHRSKYYLSVGSIINKSIHNSEVWGSGIIKMDDEISGGVFHAVRGYRTIDRLNELGLNSPSIIGDPALLLPLVYNPIVTKHYKLGIIPHYVDYELLKDKISDDKILIINLNNSNIEYVVNQILSCSNIISSSLHGLIVSHAYNIPALWYKFSNKLKGDDIKFSDYFSSVGIKDYDPFKIDFVNFEVQTILSTINNKSKINKININLTKLQNNLLSVAPFKKRKQINTLK